MSTLSVIQRRFLIRSNGVIITTRSSVVKNAVEDTRCALKLVPLHPFSVAESLELANKRLTNSLLKLQAFLSASNKLKAALGGLPLCASIYANWLAFSVKSNPDQPLTIFEKTLVSEWANIEENFSDKFHRRGLMGGVQCAEVYSKNHPMVVFLLAKICSTNCESVPWEIISKTTSSTYFCLPQTI